MVNMLEHQHINFNFQDVKQIIRRLQVEVGLENNPDQIFMLVIPAIDIKNGQCVRLRQGDLDDDTVFSTDLIAVADQWVEQGTSRLHIVDLDGAVSGEPVHLQAISAICSKHPQLSIQIGGGIRNLETAQAYFDVGVDYLILGTKAVNEPQFIELLTSKHPNKIIIGLDAKNGFIAVEGWTKTSDKRVTEVAGWFESMQVAAIIYTDIARDGMLSGVNIDATFDLARSTNLPVIASGGIKNLDDIRALVQLPSPGVAGAITGRAIYEGTLDFREAQALAMSLSAKRVCG